MLRQGYELRMKELDSRIKDLYEELENEKNKKKASSNTAAENLILKMKEDHAQEIKEMKDKNMKERIALGAVAAATVAAKMKDLQESHTELEKNFAELSQKYCKVRLERNVMKRDSISCSSSSSSMISMWERAGLQHRVVLCVNCTIPSSNALLENGIHVVYFDSEKLLISYLDSAPARVLLRCPDTSVRLCTCDIRIAALVREDLNVDIPILVLSNHCIPKTLLNVNATTDKNSIMDFAMFEDKMFKFDVEVRVKKSSSSSSKTPSSPRDRAMNYVRRQVSIRKWKHCLDSLRMMGFHDDDASLEAIEENYKRYPSSTMAQRISAVAALLSRRRLNNNV